MTRKSILKLSLTLPGNGFTVNSPQGFSSQFTNIGSIISGFFNVIFIIAGFLMFYWLVWGVFQYIFAGGNKEGLGKARQRITWAIMGFILLIFSFFVGQYIQTIFPLNKTLTPIPEPVKCITTETWDATRQMCVPYVNIDPSKATTGTTGGNNPTTAAPPAEETQPADVAAGSQPAPADNTEPLFPEEEEPVAPARGQTTDAILYDPQPPQCSDGTVARSCGIFPTSGWTCLDDNDPMQCKNSSLQGDPICPTDHPVPGSNGWVVKAYCFAPKCPDTFPNPVKGDPSKCQK